MDWEDLLEMFFAFVVVVIPVVGFTARFAINPLLQNLLKLRETSARANEASEAQLRELTHEVKRLSAAVERLEEGSSFERSLHRASLPNPGPQ